MARARNVVVVLALVMFAIIGMACAAKAPAPAPAPAPQSSFADDDYEDDYGETIGTGTEGPSALAPSSVVAAPIGGPVPPDAFDTQGSPPSAASSSLHRVSAVAGAAAAAFAGFFYF